MRKISGRIIMINVLESQANNSERIPWISILMKKWKILVYVCVLRWGDCNNQIRRIQGTILFLLLKEILFISTENGLFERMIYVKSNDNHWNECLLSFLLFGGNLIHFRNKCSKFSY